MAEHGLAGDVRRSTVFDGEVFKIGEGKDGFIALCLLQQGVMGRAVAGPPPLLFASLQIGARVASPQSPILRWSKVSVSRFRYPGTL